MTTTQENSGGRLSQRLGTPASISKQGWFTEMETMWPGQKFSLALEEFSVSKSVLFHERSKYQEILVFCSAQYGNVLCLDGVIQMTERDEFAFHEMMVHLPLFAHPHPETVCVVGGGDGGCLRELLKHSTVKRVVLVEIDPMVLHVARTYFASSTGLDASLADPRVEIVHQDAAAYLSQQSNVFDVILSDTSDPVGPAESLFQPSFYESMFQALRPQGIVCCQAECFWIHLDLISDLVACCADIFDTAEYATTMVPTYPCGQIGFLLACKDRSHTCRWPTRRSSASNAKAILSKTKWYSFEQHRAAFNLPPFVEQRLEQKFELPSAGRLGTTSNGSGRATSRSSDGFYDEYENTSEDGNECFLIPTIRSWLRPSVERSFVGVGSYEEEEDNKKIV